MHSRVWIHAAACLIGGLLTWAEDWPQWRGPRHDGTSTETGWLDTWPDEGPKIAWKANVGLGYSSFVVSKGRVFTAGHANGNDTVYCLDAATGREIWKHAYPAELGDKYFQGGTTGTPTVFQDRLYWLSRWGDLFCFEVATGKILWNKNVQKESGIRVPDWGFTGAPFPHQDLIILNIGDAGMGVDRNNGKIVWTSANKDAGYSTPLPLDHDGRRLLVFGSRESYVAVVPETGAEAWRLRWLTEYGVNAADPIIRKDRMLISTGYGKGAALFDLNQNPPREIWKSKVLRTQLNAGVRHEGHVYGMDGDTGERAPLKCIEFETGKELWAEKGIGTGGLVIASGKLIVLSAQGELLVVPASPAGFKPTARAQVLGGTCWTAPVLANGRIYCRNSRGQVACVDVRPASGGE